MKETKKELFFEILRFLIVGGTATIVEYVIFNLLTNYVLTPSLFNSVPLSDGFSQAVAFAISLLVNWFLSIIFVYKNVTNKEESRSFKSFIIFTVIGLIGLAISSIGVALGGQIVPAITIFGKEELFGTGFNTWLVKCVMTLIVLVWNYIGRKIFIFK